MIRGALPSREGVDPMPHITHVTFIGYRGTGKSTVAAMLGEQLGCGWSDADIFLEEKLGCSIASLVQTRGEAIFRDEEAAVLAELLVQCRGVLSTGGGVVLRAGNRDLLRRLGRPIVWLTAAAEVVCRRIAADPCSPQRRPSLAVSSAALPVPEGDPLAEVHATLAAREPFYRECADLIIDTSDMPPDAVARDVAAWLTEEWPQRLQDALPQKPSGGATR